MVFIVKKKYTNHSDQSTVIITFCYMSVSLFSTPFPANKSYSSFHMTDIVIMAPTQTYMGNKTTCNMQRLISVYFDSCRCAEHPFGA